MIHIYIPLQAKFFWYRMFAGQENSSWQIFQSTSISNSKQLQVMTLA